jgi:integrase
MNSFDTAPGPAFRAETLPTLQDVVDELMRREQGKADLLGMIRSTAARISGCLGREPNAVDVVEVIDLDAQFEEYLRTRRYADGSVDTYMYLFRRISAVAQEFKPSSAGSDTRQAWQKAFAALSRTDISCGLAALFHWAIRNDKKPGTFTAQDLNSFCDYSLKTKKQTYTRVVSLRNRFQRWVSKKDLGNEFPNISPTFKPRYGIQMRYLPQPLKNEVEHFLEWLGAPMSENRGRPPLRPASVKNIEKFFQQLIGFLCLGAPTVEDPTSAGHAKPGLREARDRLNTLLQEKSAYQKHNAEIEDLVRFLLEGVTGLEQVLVEKSVRGFFKWLIEVRRTAASGRKAQLSMLCEALRKFPHEPLADIDFRWIKQVIRDLPRSSRTQVDERKDEKWITFEELESIADHLARERNRCRKASQSTLALLVRNELIFRLLTWVPLREINITGCMLGSRETGGNIFKAKLPHLATLRKPDWVLERLKANPDEQFYQLYFREHETKNNQVLYCILPKDPIGLLEDYLEHFRPILCKRADSGMLFPSRSGRRLDPSSLYAMVRNTAFRLTGKPVNPHLIRDIAAVEMIDESDPKTSLYTVSRWLGHRQIGTTDRIYASKFNLSHAVRKVEELRERRRKAKEAESLASDSSHERMAKVLSLAQQLGKMLNGIPGLEQLQAQLARLTPDKLGQQARMPRI